MAFLLPSRFGALLLSAGLAAGPAAALRDGPDGGRDPLHKAPAFLPVDQAFAFTAALEAGRVVGRWRMPHGYYLYRHRLELLPTAGLVLGPPATPPGTLVDDAIFGRTEVYYREAGISAPIRSRSSAGPVSVRFVYQGCAEAGLCYPPQRRTVTFGAAASAPAVRVESSRQRARSRNVP